MASLATSASLLDTCDLLLLEQVNPASPRLGFVFSNQVGSSLYSGLRMKYVYIFLLYGLNYHQHE